MGNFNVVISGNVLPGFAKDQVLSQLAQLFNRQPESLVRLLGEQSTTIKRQVDAPTAERYVNRLRQIGIECRAEPDTLELDPELFGNDSPAASVPSACGKPLLGNPQSAPDQRTDKAKRALPAYMGSDVTTMGVPRTGYFAALAAASFKRDSNGRTVFYPFGVVGRGRVLPDAQAEEQIRRFLRTYYITSLVATVVAVVLVGAMVFLLLPFLIAWYLIKTRALSAAYSTTTDTMRFSEAYKNQAVTHHKGTLWLMLVCSIALLLIGAWNVAAGGSPFVGWAGIIFFGLGAAVFVRMLVTRAAEDKRGN